MTASPSCFAAALAVALAGAALPGIAAAQALNLGATTPGQPAPPIRITATQGIELQQKNHVVIATGNATAVRGAVTVTADSLTAHYRPKQAPAAKPGAPASPAPAAPPPPAQSASGDALSGLDTGSSQIYELEATGHVHIYTATDNAYGDHAVYMADQNLLTLTGKALKLTTPTDTVTARDSIQYYSAAHKAVANGNALVASNDGRSVSADKIVAYLQPAPQPGSTSPGSDQAAAAPPPPKQANPDQADVAASSQLKRVDAFGHVVIRTPTEVALGDHGDYEPDTGLAHLYGDVRITRGPNELMGSSAVVNMKTGVATLLAGAGGQVAGTVVPSSAPGTQPAGAARGGPAAHGSQPK
jgi:lipopolysaccharide export system protein LptA